MSNAIKKTMVFLGLAEDELDAEQQHTQKVETPSNEAAQAAPKKAEKTATVSPLRKLTPARQVSTQSMNEILTVHPMSYADVRVIAENFREDIPVIMNLSRMGDAEARRVIDFASGLAMGLEGHIERVTGKVFLLTPSSVDATSEEDYRQAEEPAAADEAEEQSFFVSAAQ